MNYTEFQEDLIKKYGRGENKPTYWLGFDGYVIVKAEWVWNGRLLDGKRQSPIEIVTVTDEDRKLKGTDIAYFTEEAEAISYIENNYPFSEVTPYRDNNGTPFIKIAEYYIEVRNYQWDKEHEIYQSSVLMSGTYGTSHNSKLPAPIEHTYFTVSSNRKDFPGDMRGQLKNGCTFYFEPTFGFNDPQNSEFNGGCRFNDLKSAMDDFMSCCGGKSKVSVSGGRINLPEGGHIVLDKSTEVTEYFVALKAYEHYNYICGGGESLMTTNMILAISDMPVKYDKTKPFSEQLKKSLEEAHLSQAAMARELNIPIKTIEAWTADTRVPPAWAAELLLERLNEMKK